MLRRILLLSVLAILPSCTSVSPSQPVAPAEQEMTAEIPGSQHAALEPFVGSFKARVAFEAPGQPEQVSFGSYDVRWMGKMWLVGTFKSDSAADPFEGQALIGYDLATRQYTTWWFDTETSVPQLSRGIWDPKSGQMIMHTDPVRSVPAMRIVTKVNPDGSITSEGFAPGKNTPEVRVMYIEYTRR